MQAITFQHAGFILASVGTVALIFAEPLARLDERLPWLGLTLDDRASRRMVEASSAGCVVLGAVLLAAAYAA